MEINVVIQFVLSSFPVLILSTLHSRRYNRHAFNVIFKLFLSKASTSHLLDALLLYPINRVSLLLLLRLTFPLNISQNKSELITVIRFKWQIREMRTKPIAIYLHLHLPPICATPLNTQTPSREPNVGCRTRHCSTDSRRAASEAP